MEKMLGASDGLTVLNEADSVTPFSVCSRVVCLSVCPFSWTSNYLALCMTSAIAVDRLATRVARMPKISNF